MTFYAPLALLLVGIGCLGLLVAIPQMVKGIEKMLAQAGMPIPAKKILISGIAGQNIFMLIIAAAIGTLLAPATGLGAPLLEAILGGGPLWLSIKPQLLPGLVGGLVSTLVFIPIYYIYFLPRLDMQTLWAIDNQRLNLNLGGRLLYNGIIEEIIARWGVMSLFIWLGSLLPGDTGQLVIWLAIFLSGAGLVLLYLPDYLAGGSLKSGYFYGFISFMYLSNAIIFGWLFWKYGWESAIIAHMIFLAIWYPYDMRLNIAKKLAADN